MSTDIEKEALLGRVSRCKTTGLLVGVNEEPWAVVLFAKDVRGRRMTKSICDSRFAPLLQSDTVHAQTLSAGVTNGVCS